MATPRKTTPKKKTSAGKSAAAKPKAKPAAKAAAAKSKSIEKPAAKSKPAPKPRPAVGGSGASSAGRTVAAKPEKQAPPAKPNLDPEWVASMRDALASQRQRLLSIVQNTQALMAEKSGDLPDVSDRASEGFEDELAVGLIAIEAAQLEDIETAIKRIDEGMYGVCVDCERAIPRKRLEYLPFARRCLACESQAERRPRAVESEEEEEDWD